MDPAHDIVANPRVILPGLVVRAAPPARPSTAESGWLEPPARAAPTTAVTPIRGDHPTTQPALLKRIEARALIEEVRPIKRPAVGAENLHDSAPRSARRRQPDETAPLSGHEATATQYDITQEELEVLHALNQRSKEMDTDREERRSRILDRLEKGGTIEPGRLKATRREADHCRPTLANLREHYGEDSIQRLRRELPPRKYVMLTIQETRS